MSTYADAVLTDAPLAFWALDDAGAQARDSSGFARDCAFVGPVQKQRPGPAPAQLAITLAGIAYAELPIATALPLPGALTIEAWVRTTDPTNFPVICGKGNYNANGNGWTLFGTTPTGVRAFAQNATVNVFDLSTHTVGAPSYADGRWHHVALTWDGTLTANAVVIWIDGVPIVRTTATGAMGVAALPLRIGIEADGTSYPWHGDLSCVAVYDHALTSARLRAHVDAMRGVFQSSYPPVVLADAPVGYWRFDDAVGSLGALDASGHGYHATRAGGVTFRADAVLTERGTAVALDGAHGTGLTIAGAQPPVPARFTLECWFKYGPTVSVDSFAYFFGSGSVAVFPQEFAIHNVAANNPQLAYYANFVGFTPGWIDVAPVTFNRWTYVAYTFDGTWYRVYVDGVQVYQTNNYAGKTFLNQGGSGGTRFLGWQGGSGFAAFRGTLDDLAWYDKPLSAGRVAAHYAAGKKAIGKALMYALGKVARGGATRGAYVSSDAFITIGGSQVGTTPVAGQRVLMDSLSITDTLEQAANTCSFRAMGFAPRVGQEIVITLGSKNSLTRLFAGEILALEQYAVADNPQAAPNQCWSVSAIDYTWLLNRQLVIAQYQNRSATEIAIDLVARFTSGFTTAHVVADLPIVDEISFTNTSVADALGQLVKRIGGYFYVDYHRDVHVYVDQESANTVTPPVPLTPLHVSMRHFTSRRDLSQFITRVFSEGGGAPALSFVVPSETLLPIEDAIWYDPTGGMVTVGPQRIHYTSLRVGGVGSLVGPGASPSTAPAAGAVAGVGLAPGLYQYAVTFGTAVGESLPSPLAAVVVSAQGLAPPQAAIAAGVLVGYGPEPGDYTYAVSFITATGETLLGNFSNSVRTLDSPARTAEYPPVIRDSGYARSSGMSAGVYQYRYGWVDYENRYTDPGPAVAYEVGANYAQLDGGLSGAIPTGMQGYTVFRTAPGGSVFKLLYFSQNSPVIDTTTDAQWNALPLWNGPTSKQTAVAVGIGGLPVSPSPDVIGRRIYRWRSGGDGLFHRVGEQTGENYKANVAFKDQVLNANVGPAAPGVSTAYAQQVALSGISVGPASVLRRYVYRSTANGTQLKRLATLDDNVSTTIPNDAASDAALGVNLPTADSSGLNLIGGQVVAGAAELLTSSGGIFDFPGGGWAVLGNGQQVIRYHGVVGNVLTGIPAAGPGAITATVNYGASITVAPTLVGIPLAGVGAIVVAIKQGDQVNLLEQVDDLVAQQQLAVYVGGDGVQESYLQDNRLSATEARARGEALLALRNQLEESVGYTSRDKNTRSGATIRVRLPDPTNVIADFKIQQVAITLFQFPHVFPTCAVQASSNRFSFEDLLRLARRAATQSTTA